MRELHPEKLREILEIGAALTSERDLSKLLDKILLSAKKFTSADGGSLYTVSPDRKLHFEITTSDSLEFHVLGVSGKYEPLIDLPLTLPDGSPNQKMIGTYVANLGKTVNIEDAYQETGFDFTGPRLFDQESGYRTKSVLALPMKNQDGEVIGVLQLINAHDPETKKIIPFSEEDAYLGESLASLAGVALTNQQLICNLQLLFESFVRVIARTIDEKSPSTGNHSRRVPILAEMLAHAVNQTQTGALAKTHLSDEEIYALKVASFLHDCGKITTPVHIMEKHSKLETIFDRIELIKTRFEVLKRDAMIERLVKKLEWYEARTSHLQQERKEAFERIDCEYERVTAVLNQELNLIEKCNKAPFVTDEMAEEIRKMATKVWKYQEQLNSFLSPDEVENLTIPSGNLTEKERKIIENHVVGTKKILSEIPFPKHLRQVPEIASNHHERVDGKGYPLGLKKEETSLCSRILVIADIFEALSAPDRPYKEALPLSKFYVILR
jgi:HD-GYP domain-containing protein (c-di-GMP phosphodiesterase class II)